MTKDVLALDLDECLFGFLYGYADWLTATGRQSFTVDQMAGFGVASLLGHTPEEGKRLEMQFLVEASIDQAPMPGAIEAVEQLTGEYELHVITARVEDVAGAATHRWVETWFPGVFAGVHLQWATLSAAPRPKGALCAELNAGGLVDDSPANLATLAAGTRGILLGEWPWTHSLTGDWEHAAGWADALALLAPPGSAG